jgi:hypothetical protein
VHRYKLRLVKSEAVIAQGMADRFSSVSTLPIKTQLTCQVILAHFVANVESHIRPAQ